MKFTKSLVPFAFLALSGLGLMGCNSADNAIDCAEVCDRYDKCLGGKDYDEGQCRSTCRDAVSNDKSLEKALDSCASCLENDMTCGQTAWKCSTECARLLPTLATP